MLLLNSANLRHSAKRERLTGYISKVQYTNISKVFATSVTGSSGFKQQFLRNLKSYATPASFSLLAME